jgi:putative endonuclease
MTRRAEPPRPPGARSQKTIPTKTTPTKTMPTKATPRPERVAAFKLGLSAESRAAMFLIAKAYRILARRWKTPFGEIDIIARRRHSLVFVEVKARATLEEAVEAVTEHSKQRIVKCRRALAGAPSA